MMAGQFDDDWTNVVFVGRVIANKKIEDLIRFFHVYHTMFNPRSRLLIVGAYSGYERYLASLHQLAATLGARHVHFLGHVSDEELVAYYDVADLFLCASEHEGFCVPLVEAFYKQVPVLAYAATAVPDTMDGAGVLYDDKDPRSVASLMDAIVSNARLAGRDRSRSSWRPSAVSRERTSQARCSASWTTSSPRRARRSRGSRSISGSSSTPRRSSKSSGCTGRPSTRRCRRMRSSSDVHDCEPVGACRPSRRRDRRQRQAGARSAADAGTSVRAVRVDDRRRSRGRRASVRRRGRAPRRSDHLPLRAAVADDLGVRGLAARPRPAVSQRDAGGVLRALRPGAVPPGGARTAGTVHAGRIRRSGARRFRVQPPGARVARVLARPACFPSPSTRHASPVASSGRRSTRFSTMGW